MIFVTVGTQLPFDRMVRAIDQWAGQTDPAPDVFAQVGPSTYVPQHIKSKPFISTSEYAEFVLNADVIVSHAGIGSIVTALSHGKPIVIIPRRLQLNEHRNDHQMATAIRFAGRPGIMVAEDENQLAEILDRLSSLRGAPPIEPFAQPELIAVVREFIDGV